MGNAPKKKSAILRGAFKGQSATQINSNLRSIVNEQNNALSRLDSYQYNNNNRYCGLNEINNHIINEIGTYLNNQGVISTDEKLKKTFYYFLGIIDLYIIARHKGKQDTNKINITFNEIMASLVIDHEDISNEYLSFKFKEQFALLIDEYIEDPDDYTEPNPDQPCNLKEIRKKLLSLKPQQLWQQFRNFCPHIHLAHENNTDNAIQIELSGIRHVLIRIFHEIDFNRLLHIESKSKFVYNTATLPRKTFLPTPITNIARITHIERNIVTNPNVSEILYEVENIIYSGDVHHTFYPDLLTHTSAPLIEYEDPRSKREEPLKKINLVPIPAAKDALA